MKQKILILVAVLVLVLAGASWWWLMKKKAPTTSVAAVGTTCTARTVPVGEKFFMSAGETVCANNVAIAITRIVKDANPTDVHHAIDGYRVDLDFQMNDQIWLPDAQGAYATGSAGTAGSTPPFDYSVDDTDGLSWASITLK